MGLLSEQWRKRAGELDAALKPLLDAPGVVPANIQAMKAIVLPEILLTLADMLDVIEAMPEEDAKVNKVRARMQRNHALRMAVAKEDWDAVDRIINESIGDSGGGQQVKDGTT